MSDNFDISTVIFALLALFVLYKLRTMLGTRTGNEPDPREINRAANDDRANPLPGSAPARPAPDLRAVKEELRVPVASPIVVSDIVKAEAVDGLNQIAAQSPDFSPRNFVDGAQGAYEMIIQAFASGNIAEVQNLLAKDVYDGFSAAVADRISRGERSETTFVSIDRSLISDAHLRGELAQITVNFASKIISATKNKADEIVDGSADKVIDINDVWTFSRDLNARDPNWKLVATETGQHE